MWSSGSICQHKQDAWVRWPGDSWRINLQISCPASLHGHASRWPNRKQIDTFDVSPGEVGDMNKGKLVSGKCAQCKLPFVAQGQRNAEVIRLRCNASNGRNSSIRRRHVIHSACLRALTHCPADHCNMQIL